MQNSSSSVHIFFKVDDTLKKEWKGLKSLSYTMYKSLLCPLKYYTNYIYKKPIVNHYILKGIIIHELYEEALKELKSTNSIEYFNKVDDNFIKEKINNLIARYKNLDKSKITSEYINKLIQEIKDSLNIRFVKFIADKLKAGYKLYIEQPNKNKQELLLFNTETDLYTKSDIILIKDDKIEIIDIKTGRIYLEYMEQVIFYLYSYLKYAESRNLNVSTLIGSIYSTKLNKYQILLYSRKDYIEKMFNSYIKKLNSIYERLNINSIAELRNFVEVTLVNTDNYQDFQFITEYNNCNFCQVKSVCPIFNYENKDAFNEFIKNLPITEKKVVFEVPKEKSINLSFFNISNKD